MITRDVTSILTQFASQYPVVSVLGPRQSGKTTIAKTVFSEHMYISFEDLDMRTFAHNDPRQFLANYKNSKGIILDEIQHVPSLLSYIQTYVDANEQLGYFILTGSENFLISQAISQTLAGRMAIVTLLPLSIHELANNALLPDLTATIICKGLYPRIYDKHIAPLSWYSFYIQQYVERDIRQIINVHSLGDFQRFLKLCAGRIGQILNISSLATDCGISVTTARSWLSILQSSYIIFLLQPHFKNFSKRLIKSPKLYFYDTGLACALLGIKEEEQLLTHYAYGNLFESLAITEILKTYHNAGEIPHLYFWRDSIGHEIDCIIDGPVLVPIEIKSGHTVNANFFTALNYWNDLAQANPSNGFVIYGGTDNQIRTAGNVITLRSVSKLLTYPLRLSPES